MNTMNTMVNKTLALVLGASILSAGVGAAAYAAFQSSASGHSTVARPV